MTNKIPQIGTNEFNDLASACFGGKQKQETLEEAAKNYIYKPQNNDYGDYNSFIAGAKWQQERSYSEEEVQVKLYECLGHFAQKHNIIINGSEIDQWFEQFKNK